MPVLLRVGEQPLVVLHPFFMAADIRHVFLANKPFRLGGASAPKCFHQVIAQYCGQFYGNSISDLPHSLAPSSSDLERIREGLNLLGLKDG